eukprot:CAMPEP_0172790726 /NCGR_PEP_ID=MMETSP1074-20121228/208112_1 /TAXON_ID=2916 /ORGANISM="Ceratium fusus, Strain PA161109" /LENGTH=53 /DNA_ID=CAMNT_0013627779 /DNA_START=677 /DNA_END=838 /DNA_ORIENTATION=-
MRHCTSDTPLGKVVMKAHKLSVTVDNGERSTVLRLTRKAEGVFRNEVQQVVVL